MSIFSLRGSYRIAKDAGDGMSSSDSFLEVIAQLVRRVLPAGKTVLDLGAGAGLLSRMLLDAGYKVTSADLFPDRCSVPCVKVDLNSAFSGQFQGRFDAVCLMEVIEHIDNPRMALREAHKLLNPSGILFVSTPDISGIYSRVRFFFTGEFAMFNDDTYAGIGHITPISRWQMLKMLDEAGLEPIEAIDYDGSPKLPRTLGDLVKKGTHLLLPFMKGHVGRQVMLFACRQTG